MPTKAVTKRYISRLSGVEGISLCDAQPDVQSNYAYFPVVFDPDKFGADRDDVFAALAENNIGARKYFYPLTSSFECYRDRFNPNETPVALRISQSVLTLPLYADLSFDDVDRICDIILNCNK